VKPSLPSLLAPVGMVVARPGSPPRRCRQFSLAPLDIERIRGWIGISPRQNMPKCRRQRHEPSRRRPLHGTQGRRRAEDARPRGRNDAADSAEHGGVGCRDSGSNPVVTRDYSACWAPLWWGGGRPDQYGRRREDDDDETARRRPATRLQVAPFGWLGPLGAAQRLVWAVRTAQKSASVPPCPPGRSARGSCRLRCARSRSTAKVSFARSR
jgi:hypothetical protein